MLSYIFVEKRKYIYTYVLPHVVCVHRNDGMYHQAVQVGWSMSDVHEV